MIPLWSRSAPAARRACPTSCARTSRWRCSATSSRSPSQSATGIGRDRRSGSDGARGRARRGRRRRPRRRPGRGGRRGPRWRSPGRASSSTPTCPCVSGRASSRPSPASRRRVGSRSSRPPDGTTNALALPSPGRVRAALRARERRALLPPTPSPSASQRRLRLRARARRRHARRPRAPALPVAGPMTRAVVGRRRRGVKVVCLSGGVGGAKLAAGLFDVARSRRAHGDRQRRRRPRGARAARLARPRLASSTRSRG